MNQFGRGGAYFALFSEIGFLLLATTLIGVGAGIWLDGRLDTRPVFIVIGFLLGAATGAIGIFRLLTRFLARLEAADREQAAEGTNEARGIRAGGRNERDDDG